MQKMPLEVRPVEGSLNEALLKDFKGERTGFVQVGPQKYLFPSKFNQHAIKYYSFKPRKDDIWIVTFPRTGTTWTQELVWLLANGLDFEKAKAIPLFERFPFLEFGSVLHDDLKRDLLNDKKGNKEVCDFIEESAKPGFEFLDEVNSPRLIKTHLPFSLLSPDLLTVGCKVIYVARNPKDVAVSYFHLHKLFRTLDFKGDFERFWNYFQNDSVIWAPFWSHIQEGWAQRSNPNVLFMFYENMSADLRKSIFQVADFLKVKIDEKDISRLREHLHITSFRSNPAVNFQPLRKVGYMNPNTEDFIRQGKNSGWKETFSRDLSEKADVWISENLKKLDGFQFPNKFSPSG